MFGKGPDDLIHVHHISPGLVPVCMSRWPEGLLAGPAQYKDDACGRIEACRLLRSFGIDTTRPFRLKRDKHGAIILAQRAKVLDEASP